MQLFLICSNASFLKYLGNLLDQGGHSLDIVKLRHPASGESAMFMFSASDDSVQELMTFSEEKRYVIFLNSRYYCTV